jgi:hypothetical protein
VAILDANWQFSNAQAVTTTADSTNIVDLMRAQDYGLGDINGPHLLVQVGTAFTGGTSLNAQFCGAPDNGSGSPGVWTTYAESGAVPVASLTAGAQLLRIPVPAAPTGVAAPRFYKFTFTVVGTMTAGTITATAQATRQASITMPSGGPTNWGSL